MSSRSMSLSTLRDCLVFMLFVMMLSACGGTREYVLEDTQNGGTPYVLLEGPTSTVPPTVTRPASTAGPDSSPTMPIAATATSMPTELPEPESAADLFAIMEQSLARHGGVYYATIEQVIDSAFDDSITPRWTGELWLDVEGNAGRSELRLHPEAPAEFYVFGPGSAPIASSAVFTGTQDYIAIKDTQIWRAPATTCGHMGDFSMVVYLICRSPVSPWPDGVSSMDGDEAPRIELNAEFNGGPAVSFTYGGYSMTYLYLDPETYLPLGWTLDMMESGKLVTTFETEFIDTGSFDSALFDPVSIGYVEPPAPTGKLAFRSDHNGEPDIFVINADGTGEKNLTDHPGWDFAPAWSPDGSRIVFTSERDGNSEIYVMNADGSGLTNLTNNPAPDFGPAWSPDGSKIVFGSDRDGTNIGELYVMNADGSNVYRLGQRDDVQHPAWSPDGNRIAFSAGDLYVVNADGTGETRLTEGMGGFLPQWVPDGSRIIFSTTLDANDEIFSVNTDGSGLRNLTNSPAFDVTPVLSPDGTHVVFDSDRENPTASTGIHILNVDSAEVARFMYLADGASCAAGCTWSPDGAYAAVRRCKAPDMPIAACEQGINMSQLAG